MDQKCRCWSDPGILLCLGGVHRWHTGFCMTCCVKIASLNITDCPICSTAFTPSEKAIISSVAVYGGREAEAGVPPQQESLSQEHSAKLSEEPPRISKCFKCKGSAEGGVKLECGHIACKLHLKEYLTAQSYERKKIKCPYADCAYICPVQTVMAIIDEHSFSNYRDQFLKEITICPRPNCRQIQQKDNEHRIVECCTCRNEYCSRCERPSAECRCELPRKLNCRTCNMTLKPNCHKLMRCETCGNTMCTNCALGARQCTCNHNELNVVLRIGRVAMCEICRENMFPSEAHSLLSMEDCPHVYHKECIEGYVTAKLESGWLSTRLTCPKRFCTGLVGDLQKLVTAEQWSLYNRKLMESQFRVVQCPNIKCLEEFTVDEDIKSITCNWCQQSFCLSCKRPPHEGSCSQAEKLVWIRMLEATGERVSQCPRCKIPYTKDEYSEHVKCMNPNCRVDFCFTCSCLRMPTVRHCSAWHRPNCKWYYEAGVETEKFQKDCPECVRLGRRCDPPKALRVPCRFDEDEE